LDQDVFVIHGDRFVLRDQSAKRTIAGGHVIDPFSPKRGRARPSRIAVLHAMNSTECRHDPSGILAKLTEISEVGVLLYHFSVGHNLLTYQMDDIIKSLSLKRICCKSQERVFSKTQWENLLVRIEKAVRLFHQNHPALSGASFRDIQLEIKPHIETEVLEESTEALVNENRLNESGKRFHLPSHIIQVPMFDRQLWDRFLASSLTLHQAADVLEVDMKVLETSLKKAVKIGEMVLVAKNRYVSTSYLTQLGYAIENLKQNSNEGLFIVSDFMKQTKTGRNFAIDLLEYFDRRGFTERLGNYRRIRSPFGTVFASDEEGS
jgi:selenocysteine-specific elongation factor